MTIVKLLVLFMLAAGAVFARRHPITRVASLSLWVLTGALTGLFFHEHLVQVRGFETRQLIVPITQLIMFCMGATLSLKDFGEALRNPKAIVITMLLQFTVMPLAGWLVAQAFGFSDAVAAGIILVGACSGGVASNVMTFLARGRVALSVSMTACSTLLAPLATPIVMTVLAGQRVDVDVVAMMVSILRIVLVPVGLGVLVHRLIRSREFLIERALPAASIAGICAAQVFVTAAAYDELMAVGLALLAAAVIHNLAGYTLGFAGARICGLDTAVSRTVSFEVGLQNAGMGIGIASAVFAATPETALASVVFSVWMNVSGAALAAYWSDRRTAPDTLER